MLYTTLVEKIESILDNAVLLLNIEVRTDVLERYADIFNLSEKFIKKKKFRIMNEIYTRISISEHFVKQRKYTVTLQWLNLEFDSKLFSKENDYYVYKNVKIVSENGKIKLLFTDETILEILETFLSMLRQHL